MTRVINNFGKFYLLAVLLAAFALTGCAGAPASPTVDTEWSFPNQIGYKDVAPLVSVPRPEGTLLIDSRPYEGRYIHGYIPTAVSLPDSAFDKRANEVLPKDKNTKLVFYCQGTDCVLSHTSAFRAQKLGYKDVAVYTGGLPDWEAHGGIPGIGLEAVKKIMEQGEQYMLVDSRPANKFADGSIPTAISIPDSKFAERQGMLPADKNTRLIFFCSGHTCVLSHQSAAKAKALGYTNIAIAEAGYPGWTELYGAGAAVGSAKSGEPSGIYPVVDFEKAVKTGSPAIMVVDVRGAAEFKAGSMPGAVNIPVDDLEAKLATLPQDKPVVFICTTGARSGEAYYMAIDKFPNSTNFYYLEANTKFLGGGKYQISPNTK